MNEERENGSMVGVIVGGAVLLALVGAAAGFVMYNQARAEAELRHARALQARDAALAAQAVAEATARGAPDASSTLPPGVRVGARLVIHGPPGEGKTWTVNEVRDGKVRIATTADDAESAPGELWVDLGEVAGYEILE